MFSKILKRDLVRNKMIHLVLFLFLFLSAYLATGAVSILTGLSGSMEHLLEATDSTHFAQMHSGDISETEISEFAQEHDEVIEQWQITELLNVEGGFIWIGDNEGSEEDSVLEHAFVVQNEKFDYLLDLDNEVLAVQPGEIAVPVYHMQQYGLKAGDRVRVAQDGYEKEFVITAFLRDSLMNSSMITSKRLLISQEDWQEMHNNIGEIEYMIELQAADAADAGRLENLYETAGLPAKGTGITWMLVKLINAMSDGLTAAMMVLAAILILLIAMLCLKFTITASMEEEYREIGAMKALGISAAMIRHLYLVKYIAISLAAGGLGWAAGIVTRDRFLANITLYMGTTEPSLWEPLLSLTGVSVIILFIIGFCSLVLRKFGRISAAEAVRYGRGGEAAGKLAKRSIGQTVLPDINIAYGVRAVTGSRKSYGTLCLIYILATFLMIIPVNLLTTLRSPEFISYMGTGVCDIRIDIQEEGMKDKAQEIAEYLEQDGVRYSLMKTYACRVRNAEGKWERIKIETGDFQAFPQEYAQGEAPLAPGQIALSALQAEELEVQTGESLELIVNGIETVFQISGTYQDVTNGGKTAKATFVPGTEAETSGDDEMMWIIVYIQLPEDVSTEVKIAEYRSTFSGVKVTDMETYLAQTLGSVISQLDQAVALASGLAVIITILITALFFRMLMAKEARQIVIMQSLGFTRKDICRQYITRGLIVLAAGITLGTAGVYLLGGKLAGLVITGVTELKFIVNPWISYLGCPAVLAAAVMITIWAAGKTMRRASDLKSISE